ncbi:hypothetical protein CC79DRAFT_1373321 [Sarocladium strictum]
MAAAVEDIIATVGTWLAVVLALVALIGVITPYLILKATSSDRARALRAIDVAETGYVRTKLKLSRTIRFHTVKVPLLTSRPGLKNGPKLKSKLEGNTTAIQQRRAQNADEELASIPAEQISILPRSSTSWVVLAHLATLYSDNVETGDSLILRGNQYWFPMHRYFVLAVGLRGRYGARQHFTERLDITTSARIFTELSEGLDEEYYSSSRLLCKLYGTNGTLWWRHRLDSAGTRVDELYYAPHIYDLSNEDLLDPVPLDELFWLAIGCLPIRGAQGTVCRVYDLSPEPTEALVSFGPARDSDDEQHDELGFDDEITVARQRSPELPQQEEDRRGKRDTLVDEGVATEQARIHFQDNPQIEVPPWYVPQRSQQGQQIALSWPSESRDLRDYVKFTPRKYISTAHREWADAVGASEITHEEIYHLRECKFRTGPRDTAASLYHNDRQRMAMGLLRLTISPHGYLTFSDKPIWGFFQDDGRVGASDSPAMPRWTATALRSWIRARWFADDTKSLRSMVRALRANVRMERREGITFSRRQGALCFMIDESTSELLGGGWMMHHVVIAVLVLSDKAFREHVMDILNESPGQDPSWRLEETLRALWLGDADYDVRLEDEFLRPPTPSQTPTRKRRSLFRGIKSWIQPREYAAGNTMEMTEHPQVAADEEWGARTREVPATQEQPPRQTIARQTLWLILVHCANRLIYTKNHINSRPLLKTVNKMSAVLHVSPSMSVPMWSSDRPVVINQRGFDESENEEDS